MVCSNYRIVSTSKSWKIYHRRRRRCWLLLTAGTSSNPHNILSLLRRMESILVTALLPTRRHLSFSIASGVSVGQNELHTVSLTAPLSFGSTRTIKIILSALIFLYVFSFLWFFFTFFLRSTVLDNLLADHLGLADRFFSIPYSSSASLDMMSWSSLILYV